MTSFSEGKVGRRQCRLPFQKGYWRWDRNFHRLQTL